MIFEILIVLITTLIGYYFYKHRQVQDFFNSRGVKFIPGVPFFGNMYHSTFWKKHFLDELQEVHDAFPDEKYVGFVEFTLPILLIRDPELIKTITVKDFDHFTDHRGFFSEDADPLLSGSLLLMKGEIWREMRTTLSPAFTASKMKLMYPIIVENANKIIEYLQGHEHQNIEVDDLMRRYSNDVSASAGFGLQINSLKDRDNEFYKIGSTLFHFDMKQRMILMLFALFPTLCKKSGMRLFPKRTNDFFRNIVGSTMEYRKKEQVERPDMIQLLMEAKKGWTANDLTAQVFIFFAAGFDSSASALVMAIHELAINPDVQEKLYQECRKLKEENQKDGGLSFDKLGELKYLEWVISVETW